MNYINFYSSPFSFSWPFSDLKSIINENEDIKIVEQNNTLSPSVPHETFSGHPLKNLSLLPQLETPEEYMNQAVEAKEKFQKNLAISCIQQSLSLDPHNQEGWLLFAELYEDLENYSECIHILKKGLTFCQYSEKLWRKIVKIEAKIKNFSGIYQWIDEEKKWPPDWNRTVECHLLAADLFVSLGYCDDARGLLNFHLQTDHSIIIFHKLIEIEEGLGNTEAAISLCAQARKFYPKLYDLIEKELQLREILSEKLYAHSPENLKQALEILRGNYQGAFYYVQKDVLHKLFCSYVEFEYRFQKHFPSEEENFPKILNPFMDYCCQKLSPSVYRYLYVKYADIMALKKKTAEMREFFQNAFNSSAFKYRRSILLEWASREEYLGDYSFAENLYRKILSAETQDLPPLDMKKDWKSWLHFILFEMRLGNFSRAKELTKSAMQKYPQNGRLFEIWLSLHRYCPNVEQTVHLWNRAVSEYSKCGEVWCELARSCMDPSNSQYNLELAESYIKKAVVCTPQYGDSFILYMAIKLLKDGKDADLSEIENQCILGKSTYGILWSLCKLKPFYTPLQVLSVAKELILRDLQNQVMPSKI